MNAWENWTRKSQSRASKPQDPPTQCGRMRVDGACHNAHAYLLACGRATPQWVFTLELRDRWRMVPRMRDGWPGLIGTGRLVTWDATGAIYVNFPGVCKHFGWNPTKLCGPTVMAMGASPEGNCCFFHPPGCALHNKPKVNGKPFVLSDHKAKLEELGLAGYKAELAELRKTGGKPPGTPRKIGKAMVYPVPHFA